MVWIWKPDSGNNRVKKDRHSYRSGSWCGVLTMMEGAYYATQKHWGFTVYNTRMGA